MVGLYSRIANANSILRTDHRSAREWINWATSYYKVNCLALNSLSYLQVNRKSA